MDAGFNGITADDFAGVYRDKDGNVIPDEVMAKHRMAQHRVRMRERYVAGFPAPTLTAKVPEVDLSFLDPPKGVHIRWYHRLLWRVVRWARGAM